MDRVDRFTALIDACVLGSALKRNLILSLAHEGLFRPRWSPKILDETERAIKKISKGKAETSKQRAAMEKAFPHAMVSYSLKVEGMLHLPDLDDRHVLAAAIGARADVLVTDNLKDFPAHCLAPFEISAVSCDEFVADCIDLDVPRGLKAVRAMRLRLKHPQVTPEDLILKIEANRMFSTAQALRRYSDHI